MSVQLTITAWAAEPPTLRIVRDDLAFDGSGISEIAYEDTEHYAVTRDFLNHYPRRLEQLLAPD